MPGSEAVYVHREPGESWGRVLQTGNLMASVADPDPGSGAFLTPGSRIRDG